MSDQGKQLWALTLNELSARARSQITSAALEAIVGQTLAGREARDRVAAEGMVIADPKGNPIPHPALGIERAASAEVRAWSRDLASRR